MTDSTEAKAEPNQRGEEYLHLKFFAQKVGIITNSARIISFTTASFIAKDYSGKVRETIDFADIDEILPSVNAVSTEFNLKDILPNSSAKKEFEVVIRKKKDMISYIIEPKKEHFLSVLHFLRDDALKLDKEMFNVQRINADESLEEVMLLIAHSMLEIKSDTFATLSSDFLPSLHSVQKNNDRPLEFALVFGDPEAFFKKIRIVAPDQATVSQVIAKLERNMDQVYAMKVDVQVVENSEFSVTHPCLHPEWFFYFKETVFKFGKNTAQPRELIFGLTDKYVVLWEKQHPYTLVKVKEIAKVVSVVLSQDYLDRITIHFRDLSHISLSCPRRYVFVSNIVEIAKQIGTNFVEISYAEIPEEIRVGPYERDADTRFDGYFVEKLVEMPGNPSSGNKREFAQSIRECNLNVLDESMAIRDKEKRLLTMTTDWYNAIGLDKEYYPELITEIFMLVNRVILSSAKTNFDDMANSSKIRMIVSSVMKADSPRLREAGTVLLGSILSRTVLTKEYVSTRGNLISDLCVQDIIPTLTEIIRRFDEADDKLYLAYLYMEILVVYCRLPQLQDKTLLALLTKHITVFFDLSRVACYALNQKAATILQFILDQSANEPTLHKSLQEQCRDHCALIWQVYLAVSSRSTTCAQVVASMARANPDSMDLIARVFPSGFVKRYTRVAPPPMPTGKAPKKRSTQAPAVNPPPLEIDFESLFYAAQENFEEPALVWNDSTRAELCASIQKEINTFYLLKNATTEKNCVWNWEEFSVYYSVLESEIRVGQYYANQILKCIPNLEINEPQEFISQMLLKLYSRTVSTYTEVVILKVLSWCYGQYHARLATNLIAFENIIALLRNSPEQVVMDQWLTFLNEIFTEVATVREFVQHGGIPIIVSQLTKVHSSFEESLVVSGDLLTPIHPSVRGSVVLNLLTRCITYMNPLNASNQIKLPFSRVKAILSEPENVARIVQVFATFATSPLQYQLVDLAIGLLEHLIAFNDLVATEIYKTGIFYFLLQYEGNNFTGIARFLSKLHWKQKIAPHSSILSTMLPKTLIDLLDTIPPVAETSSDLPHVYFAQVFCSEVYSPVLVWNQTMRQHLIKEIRKHVGTFIQALPENSASVYQFCPIAPISYPMLDPYFRCGNLFVPYLLKEKTWPIDDPESVLQDAQKIIASFDTEGKYMLPSEPGESFFEVSRNVDGKISSPARISGDRRVLILQLVATLYQRYPQTYSFSPFAHYPIVYKWISENVNCESLPFLGTQDDSLVTTAVDFLLTSVTGNKQPPPNLEIFIETSGVKCVGDALHSFTFWKRQNVYDERTDKIQMNILEIIHKCVPVTQHIAAIMEISIIRDILRFLLQESPRVLVVKALAVMMDLLDIPELRVRSYLCGAHYYLIPLMLQPVLSQSSTSTPASGSDDVRATALNAARAMGRMVGLLDDKSVNDEVKAKIQRAISKLITPGLYHVLDTAASGQDFLFFLQKDHFTPTSYWNRNVMAELMQHVLKWLRDNKNSDDVTVPFTCEVRYSDHLRELMIGDVFLSAYIQNPRYALDFPRFFLQKLFEVLAMFTKPNFQISELPDWRERDYSVPAEYSAEDVVYQITEAVKHVTNQYKDLDDEVGKNIYTLLNLVTVSSTFPEEVIRNTFTVLTQLANNPAGAGYFAPDAIIYHIAAALRSRFAGRDLVLRIFVFLCANSAECIDTIVKTGTILYLFQATLDSNSSIQDRMVTRELSLTVLRQMLFNPSRHENMKELFLRFLPLFLVAMLQKDPSELSNKDFMNLLDKTQELPELLWNDATRSELAHAITNQILLLENSSSDIAEWYSDEFAVEYKQIQRELKVGGIFVRIFNQAPSVPSDPADFLTNLLTTTLDPSFSEKFPVLIESIYNILSLQPALIIQIGPTEQEKLQSVVSLILNSLDSRSQWDDLRLLKHLIMTLRLLANSKTSPLLNFSAGKALTPLIKILKQNSLSDFHVRCLEIMVFLVKNLPLDSEFLTEAAAPEFGLVSCLCDLIDNTDEADKSKKAVEILFNLRNNERLKRTIIEQVGTREKVVEGLNNFESNRAASVFFSANSGAAGAGFGAPRSRLPKTGEPMDFLKSLDDDAHKSRPYSAAQPSDPFASFGSSPSRPTAFSFDPLASLGPAPSSSPAPNFTTSGLDTIMKPIDDGASLDSLLRAPTKSGISARSRADSIPAQKPSTPAPIPEVFQRPISVSHGFSTSPPKKPLSSSPATSAPLSSSLPPPSSLSSSLSGTTPPHTSPTPYLSQTPPLSSSPSSFSTSVPRSESIKIASPQKKMPAQQDDDFLSFLASPSAPPPTGPDFTPYLESNDMFSPHTQTATSSLKSHSTPPLKSQPKSTPPPPPTSDFDAMFSSAPTSPPVPLPQSTKSQPTLSGAKSPSQSEFEKIHGMFSPTATPQTTPPKPDFDDMFSSNPAPSPPTHQLTTSRTSIASTPPKSDIDDVSPTDPTPPPTSLRASQKTKPLPPPPKSEDELFDTDPLPSTTSSTPPESDFDDVLSPRSQLTTSQSSKPLPPPPKSEDELFGPDPTPSPPTTSQISEVAEFDDTFLDPTPPKSDIDDVVPTSPSPTQADATPSKSEEELFAHDLVSSSPPKSDLDGVDPTPPPSSPPKSQLTSPQTSQHESSPPKSGHDVDSPTTHTATSTTQLTPPQTDQPTHATPFTPDFDDVSSAQPTASQTSQSLPTSPEEDFDELFSPTFITPPPPSEFDELFSPILAPQPTPFQKPQSALSDQIKPKPPPKSEFDNMFSGNSQPPAPEAQKEGTGAFDSIFG